MSAQFWKYIEEIAQFVSLLCNGRKDFQNGMENILAENMIQKSLDSVKYSFQRILKGYAQEI